jgi:hypothetical protein
MDSLQLGGESDKRNPFVAVFGTLFQPFQKLPRRTAAIGGFGEEEIVFRMLERQRGFYHVADGHRRHLADARAPSRPGAREDDLPAFRRADPPVVEGDHAASRSDAVDDPGIPPIQFRG